MRALEQVGEAVRKGAKRAEFFIRHDTFFPDTVERARKACIKNREIVQKWVDRGMISQEEIDQLQNDEEVQQQYSEMMKKVYDKEKHFQLAVELGSLSLVNKAGWFEYFRKHFERRFNADLLREEPYTV